MSGGWQAVALSREVGRRPLRVRLDGTPLVLFRGPRGIAALIDRCPHRMVELSTGRVVAGEIECPYHGWRFDPEGRCTAIPGLIGALPHYRARALRATERGGVVFVANGPTTGDPYLHPAEGQRVLVRHVRSATRSTLVDAAENILDATHTHYTHKGLLRGLSSRRVPVRVEVTGGAGWVEASYTGEERAEGLVSKLLEGARVRTVGRFRHPGIAELEYWGPKGLVLATTFHLRQADTDTVEGIGLLVGPDRGPLDRLKALAFRPLFRIALEQDRRVLASAQRNARLEPRARPVIGPLDILRRDIEAILAGDPPSCAGGTRVHRIEL